MTKKYLCLFGGVCVFLFGVYIGKSFRVDNPWKNIIPSPRIVQLDGPKPEDFNEGTLPDVRERLEVDPIYITDTLIVEVPVPEDFPSVDSLSLVGDRPLEVNRPLFGTPSVTLTTYPIEGGAFERQTWVVPEHPVKYGVAVDAFYEADIGGLEPRVGLGIEPYVGYRNVHVFGGADLTSDGLRYRVGTRVRLGR